MRQLKNYENRNVSYVIRVQIAIICSLILFVLLFRYWPENWSGNGRLSDRFENVEILTPDMIVASQQVAVERTAPPVPRPDVTVPEDEVVDMMYDLRMDGIDMGEPIAYPEPPGDAGLVEQPDRPPNVRRIVEPVTPSQARRDNIRVEIVILFTVSADGEVEEAEVYTLRLFNKQTGAFEEVAETGYGFREITIRAARQWLFHPAQHDGEPVRSRTRHRFTFGNGS